MVVLPVLTLWGIFVGGQWSVDLASAMLLSLVSFADDRWGLPIFVRFPFHVLAAFLFVWLAVPVPPAWRGILVILIVWSTNLFNFMDGCDGLAGGMAVIGFAVYATAAWPGDRLFSLGCLAASGAAAGFLFLNFHPARVFLGDSGAIPLGYLFAVWGVAGVLKGLWSPLFPAVVLAPFWVDATVTLVRRVFRGEAFWKPHRSHYYQRLIQIGWGHRRTALVWYGVMVVFGLVALLFYRSTNPVGSLLAFCLIPPIVAALRYLDRRCSGHFEIGCDVTSRPVGNDGSPPFA